MLRMIRRVGLIIFAISMSYSAHALYRMYKSGALFEEYNHARRSNITLFATSALAVIAITGYEIKRTRKAYGVYHEYGPVRPSSGKSKTADDASASCIYASRESVDPLPNRTTPGYLTERDQPLVTKADIWMKMLRIVCLLVPFVNLIVFMMLFAQHSGRAEVQWLVPALCALYVLVGILTAMAVFYRRPWGLSCGYLLAIINLILFPYGTVLALFLLISLVGAAPLLAKPRKRIRVKSRSAH